MNISKVLILFILFFLKAGAFPWTFVSYNNEAIEEYKKENFIKSEELLYLAEKEKVDSLEIKFNLANSLYKNKKFVESQSKYLEILNNKSISNNLKKNVYYNLGNVLYRLGEKDSPEIYWENSLNNYKEALKIDPEDKETKENYRFVLDKLNKINNNKKQNNKNSSDNKDKSNKNNNNQNSNSNSNNNKNKNEEENYNEFVSNAETEKILEEMKKYELSNIDLLNRNKIGLNQESSKNW